MTCKFQKCANSVVCVAYLDVQTREPLLHGVVVGGRVYGGVRVGCMTEWERKLELQGSSKMVPEGLVTTDPCTTSPCSRWICSYGQWREAECIHRPESSVLSHLFYQVEHVVCCFCPRTPTTPCLLKKAFYRPCRIFSASCRLPNSHAFKKPCSERSMFLIDVISCAGGLLTRDATTTGSVSRMMPSSTSSSTASDYPCEYR